MSLAPRATTCRGPALSLRCSGCTLVLCALLVGVAGPLAAQVPAAPAAQPAAAAPQPDPLGRNTPFGTVTGFSHAVRRGDFAVAARYLQVTNRSSEEIEDLARNLSDLLDRYFTQPLTALSTAPAGTLNDGLEANRDRIRLTIGESDVDFFLERVTDPAPGPIWLFSSESLARVPRLHRSLPATWVESVMPAGLVAREYLGNSLAQWILWAASILVPLLLFWTIGVAIAAVARRQLVDATRRALFESWWKHVRWLFILGLTLGAHLASMRSLGFGVTFRYAYARIALTAGVIILALLVWRLMSVTFHHARLLAMRRGRSGTQSLILLGERIAKVIVVLVAVFVLLGLAGVDLTTALAGVGIAGVALALGAQKSIENLLGGIFLLTDRALAVGDYCRVSDREGWIEDVTLRSVRLRTLEQTLLSIPAGQLADGSIENFSTRGKILVQSVLRLRYGTTADQLQAILNGIRQLFANHPLIERESARARLTAFGVQAVELEVFAYVMTSDFQKFLEVRESLLMQVAHVVEASGSGFAAPTQLVQMRDDESRASLPAPEPAAPRVGIAPR